VCRAEAAWFPGEIDPPPPPRPVATNVDVVPSARLGENVHLPLPNSPAGLGERSELDPRAVTLDELSGGCGSFTHPDLTELDRFHVAPGDEPLSPTGVHFHAVVLKRHRPPPLDGSEHETTDSQDRQPCDDDDKVRTRCSILGRHTRGVLEQPVHYDQGEHHAEGQRKGDPGAAKKP